MFGMGWQEILLILVIGVLVIGPEQLPTVARTIGRLVAQFKRATNDLRTAVSEEIAQNEELGEFKTFTSDLQSEVNNVRDTAQGYLDKEIDKGERELAALEKDVADDGGNSGPMAEDMSATDYGPKLNGGETVTAPEGKGQSKSKRKSKGQSKSQSKSKNQSPADEPSGGKVPRKETA